MLFGRVSWHGVDSLIVASCQGAKLTRGEEAYRLAGEELSEKVTYPDRFAGQNERIEMESKGK